LSLKYFRVIPSEKVLFSTLEIPPTSIESPTWVIISPSSYQPYSAFHWKLKKQIKKNNPLPFSFSGKSLKTTQIEGEGTRMMEDE